MRTGDGPGRFVWEGSYCSRPEPTENGLIGEDWTADWDVCVCLWGGLKRANSEVGQNPLRKPIRKHSAAAGEG